MSYKMVSGVPAYYDHARQLCDVQYCTLHNLFISNF